MEWIVKIEKTQNEVNPHIEDEKDQRIRIVFDPLNEKIYLYGECKIKNNKWKVFSEDFHEMTITLEQLQGKMNDVVFNMRKRLNEYENLDKGFSVLKWIAFEEEE